MANLLKPEKQLAVIRGLVEGCSVRSVERMTGVHRDTIIRFMVRVGQGCEQLLDEVMVDLPCESIQVDEIWSFVAKKQKQVTLADDPRRVGDTWVWVAIDADSKLVPSFLVGKRSEKAAHGFVNDLARRMKNRVQLSSDGLGLYVSAVQQAFGGNVDYGQIVKVFEAPEFEGQRRYSPPQVVSIDKYLVIGDPNPEEISTSFVERQNLTMRMQMRRFTRLTNAFSKKVENHRAAVALHFGWYNLARVHRTLRVTPAMEAGIQDHVWGVDELIDAALQRAA